MSNDLTMERTYPAPPRAVYDAFLGLYGENRPDWIVESRLDLRPGGSWRVVFHPPGLEAFTEERVVSAVEPPHRLAYAMTALFPPHCCVTWKMISGEQSHHGHRSDTDDVARHRSTC